MRININHKEKKRLETEIEDFYYNVRETEIDVIEKQEVLDFILEKAAPLIYNKALDDARQWYNKRQANLESDFFALYKNTDE